MPKTASKEKRKGRKPSTERTVKVLLVEDEDSFVEALSVGLAHEGFEVTVRDLPLQEHMDVPVQAQLIVELYSK
jgi:ribosomal protein S4